MCPFAFLPRTPRASRKPTRFWGMFCASGWNWQPAFITWSTIKRPQTDHAGDTDLNASMLPPLFFSIRVPTLLARFWRTHVFPPDRSSRGPHGPVSGIVFRLDTLGDVVLTTPLFRELKRAYPNSRCTV